MVGTLAVGVLGAGFAIAFRLALRGGMRLLLGSEDVLLGFAGLPPLARVALPALGGLLAGLVATLSALRVEGQGIAEILASLVLGRGELSMRATLWKALASLCAIVTGGSIGREGPIIQFGAAAGSALGARLALPARRVRTLVAAGTAAGFAAAYNTPLAAVLFVLEVFTGSMALEVVAPVVVATVVATYLTRLVAGGGPLYGQRTFTLASDAELGLYVALGLLAGLLGAGFLDVLSRAEVRARAALGPRWLRAALGGLGVGLIATRLPEVTGNGYEAIQLILDGRLTGGFLAVLLASKGLATVSSVSTGSPGGVFTPSLFLGAALGGLMGSAAPHLLALPGATNVSGAYALVGMAAVIAATTRAPVMAATLVFELSGDYAVVLPLLLATGTAAVVSRWLRVHSVYAEEVRKRGLVWVGGLAEHLARSVRASDLLQPAPMLAPDRPLAEALRLLGPGGARAVYVARVPLGVLTAAQALQALDGPQSARTVGELAQAAVVVAPGTELPELSQALQGSALEELAVAEPAHPDRLLGVVTRAAVLAAYDREVLQREPAALSLDEPPPER